MSIRSMLFVTAFAFASLAAATRPDMGRNISPAPSADSPSRIPPRFTGLAPLATGGVAPTRCGSH